MKDHLLKTNGTGSDTHSIYRNPDEELRQKIAGVIVDRSEVMMGFPERIWNITQKEGDEYRCESGRDISYFKNEEVERALSEKLEKERNRQYLAHKYFKKHFGILSNFQEFEDETFYSCSLDKIDLVSPVFIGNNFNPISVEHYSNFYNYHLSCGGKQRIAGIHLSVCPPYGSSMKLYFDSDGNYVNRDYNVDLNLFENKDISPSILVDKFKERVLGLGNKLRPLQYSKGKYFTKEYCLIPFFENERDKYILGVNTIPVRDDGNSYQEYPGAKIYKRPAKIEERSVESLLSDTLALMSDGFRYMFDIHNEKVHTEQL